MVENKRLTKSKSRKAKPYYVAAFLLVVIVGVIAVYFVQVDVDNVVAFFTARKYTGEQKLAVQKTWAERLEIAGVPNFHKVSEKLYRGGQPTAEGMQQLEKLGIKTIINLRSFHSDRDEIKGTGSHCFALRSKTVRIRVQPLVRFNNQ